jgi:hypothetical protein
MDDRSDRRYLKRSLGLSIGLHCLALPALVAIFLSAQWGNDAAQGAAFEKRETTTISYLTIDHRIPPHRSPARARERVLPPPVVPRRVVPLERPLLAHRAMVHTTGPVVLIAIADSAAHAAKHVAVVTVAEPSAQDRAPAADAVPAPVLEQSPAPTPLPTISASPAVIAEDKSARGSDVPPGGWGQSFEHPLVADDVALGDLRSKYHAASHASIAVDESGKPVKVTLPAGLSDDVRADLEHALMQLRYVPAECNGLHCPGTLELTL